MKIIPVDLPEIVLIEPRAFEDRRGYFLETYQARRFADVGIAAGFVQDNVSFSRKVVWGTGPSTAATAREAGHGAAGGGD